MFMSMVLPASAKFWDKLSEVGAAGYTALRGILKVGEERDAWEGKISQLKRHEVWEWWCWALTCILTKIWIPG